METIIEIENETLANYIMFKLDKIENEFTIQELDKITEVVIDYNDKMDNVLDELLKLNKLQTITLRNGYVSNDDYNVFLKLNNLSEIVFENCEFERNELISSLKLKSLSLINCEITNYSFINLFETLEELTIISGKVEIKKINKLNNLRYLQISYSDIIDSNELNIKALEELYIDNTNINNFDFLNNLNNLKRLSIDEKQYEKNKELFKYLMEKDILILNENMVEFGGGEHEI